MIEKGSLVDWIPQESRCYVVQRNVEKVTTGYRCLGRNGTGEVTGGHYTRYGKLPPLVKYLPRRR